FESNIYAQYYKRFLMYIDSNYDVSFDVHVYENLFDDTARRVATFDGETFHFLLKDDGKDYVEILTVNDNINSLPRNVRFPIHDAIEILNDTGEYFNIRIRANSLSNVELDKRDDLFL